MEKASLSNLKGNKLAIYHQYFQVGCKPHFFQQFVHVIVIDF
jgi:hypothetical protein